MIYLAVGGCLPSLFLFVFSFFCHFFKEKESVF